MVTSKLFWSILPKIPTYVLSDAESSPDHFDTFGLVVGPLRGRKKGKNQLKIQNMVLALLTTPMT